MRRLVNKERVIKPHGLKKIDDIPKSVQKEDEENHNPANELKVLNHLSTNKLAWIAERIYFPLFSHAD